MLHEEFLVYHTFANAPIGMSVVATDGKWLRVNAALCNMLGYSEQELLQINMQSVTHVDDVKENLRLVQLALDGEINYFQLEKRYYHKKGHMVWGLISVSLIRDEQGKPLHFIGHIQDITKLKRTEMLLRQNQQRYKSLIEQYPDLVLAISIDGKRLIVNDACEKVTGYSQEELINMHTIIHEHDIPNYRKQFQRALKGESQEFEGLLIHKLGHNVNIRVTLVPIIVEEVVEGVYCSVKDVTEFKKASKKVIYHEELYKLISKNAQDLISYSTPEGITQYVSPAIKSLLGYEPEEAIGKATTEFWHPEDVATVINSNVLRNSDSDIFTCRVRHKNGHYIWFETTVKAIRNENGELTKILGIGRDITERIVAQETIQKSEENYRKLVEDLPEAVVIAQGDKWLFVNDTAVELLGASSKMDVLNRSVWEIVHPDHHDNEKRRMDIVDIAREALPATEEKFIRLDGRVIDVEIECFPALFENEPVRYKLIKDITDRKQAQELMINSEKLSVVGQLAAGIAHEIRNPLTAVKGFLKLLMPQVKDKRQYFDVIGSEIDRIEEILNELLILAKPQVVHFDQKDVRSVLQQVITLMDTQALMKSVQFKSIFDSEELIIHCDENQLKQIFINFIKNAIESMDDGGEITITARRSADLKSVDIIIVDQGCGIPKEQLEKLGQPFFTTKEKGTGLGMMVSKKIIENHSGTLNVTSEVNVGTKVHIVLPFHSNI